jgi:hypothetical protein
VPDDSHTTTTNTSDAVTYLLNVLDKRLRGIDESLSDIQAFPPARDPIGGGSGGGMTVPGGLGQVAEQAIRNVLGYRVRPGDARGFAAALDQAFVPSTTPDGYTQLLRRPRGFAMQADLGALTGAQASLYARAVAARDEALKALDALLPLSTTADPQDVEAIRDIIRGELIEVVDQLGAEGGPPVQLVDKNFNLLIDYQPTKSPPFDTAAATVGGHLGELRSRFGLTPDEVNTLDEERNFTNFIVLVDYISSLALSWNSQRAAFSNRTSGAFLGTQLVQLSRSLEVVLESVDDVEEAMDSVLLGAAERQTIDLTFSADPLSGTTTLTVAEVLDAVERFASEEGPHVIQDSGKDGVQLDFTPKVAQLHLLVSQGMLEPGDPNLPAAFSSKRVQNAVGQLVGALERTRKMAAAITREPPSVIASSQPNITSVALSRSGAAGPTFTIQGDGFESGASATLRHTSGASVTISTVFLSSRQLSGVTEELLVLPPGVYSQVIVRNPSGSSATWSGLLTFEAARAARPVLTGVTPAGIAPGGDHVNFVIRGENLLPTVTVQLTPWGQRGRRPVLVQESFATREGTEVPASIARDRLPPGQWRINVVNPGAGSATLTSPLDIAGQAP